MSMATRTLFIGVLLALSCVGAQAGKKDKNAGGWWNSGGGSWGSGGNWSKGQGSGRAQTLRIELAPPPGMQDGSQHRSKRGRERRPKRDRRRERSPRDTSSSSEGSTDSEDAERHRRRSGRARRELFTTPPAAKPDSTSELAKWRLAAEQAEMQCKVWQQLAAARAAETPDPIVAAATAAIARCTPGAQGGNTPASTPGSLTPASTPGGSPPALQPLPLQPAPAPAAQAAPDALTPAVQDMIILRIGRELGEAHPSTWTEARTALEQCQKRTLMTLMGRIGLPKTDAPSTAVERAALILDWLQERAGVGRK